MCGPASRARAVPGGDAPLRAALRPPAGRCTTCGWTTPATAAAWPPAAGACIERLRPQRLVMTAPGDWRVLQALRAVAQAAAPAAGGARGPPLLRQRARVRRPRQGPQALRMEYFYREMRQRHGVLMGVASPPAGSGTSTPTTARPSAAGPGRLPPPPRFEPDADHARGDRAGAHALRRPPGPARRFAWPVTRAQALQALHAFIAERLPLFGRYQDAMWPGEPWLYHAHLSPR
jgi:deoxyribodipyrimidine photolyase-related protein